MLPCLGGTHKTLIENLFTIQSVFICICCMQISMALDGAHLSPTVTQVPLLPTGCSVLSKANWHLYLDKLCVMGERGIFDSNSHFLASILTHLGLSAFWEREPLWHPSVIVSSEKNDSAHFSRLHTAVHLGTSCSQASHMAIIILAMTSEEDKINFLPWDVWKLLKHKNLLFGHLQVTKERDQCYSDVHHLKFFYCAFYISFIF